METPPFHAGQRLKHEREARGLTQDEVAHALGLSGRTAVSRIERKSEAFRLPLAQAVAAYFNLPLDHFLPGLGNASPGLNRTSRH